MNSVLFKLANISNFLLANGAGRSNGTKSGDGSWFVEVLSWLADAIVNIATVVWGWVITMFYFVIKFILNLIDVLQMFVEKLVGIEAFNQEGGLSALENFEDSDLIIRFISNEAIIKTFTTLLGLGGLMLIIFSIIAIVRNNYAAATSDGSDAGKGPGEVLKKAGRAIFLCLLVPFLLIFGILGSNAVLASVCNAIRGENDLTIGGLIFTASSYEANKFREYASDGLKVPIYLDTATEVINPTDYATKEDMQVLFYKLAKGDVYIEIISKDPWFINKQSEYTWTKRLTAEHARINTSEITGSVDIFNFTNDCDEFYNHYYDEDIMGNIPDLTLNDLYMSDPLMKSIYKTNWTNNKKLKNVTYDFSSTYTIQSDASVAGQNGKPVYASIYVNSDSYQDYEKFATIELEYFVMADVIDYAIEHNKQFFYVDAKSPAIKWSEIDNPYDPDNKYNIGEYAANAVITATNSGRNEVYSYNVDDGKTNYNNAVAHGAFYVRYYNGETRLYFSKDGAQSENDGATYIICTQDSEGNYIPLNQKTTTFRSGYLADDYGGPVVARGIFETESVFPKDYCLPTAISEQIVDENGNELSSVGGVSPFALGDTYYESETVNTINAVGNFFGKAGQFAGVLGTLAGKIIEGVAEGLAQDYLKDLEKQEAKFIEAIGIDNLLVNKNIVAYQQREDANGKKIVSFYDKDGAKISAGSAFEDPDTVDFEASINSDSGYVILQTEVFGNYVVPWFATGTSLDTIVANILGNSEGVTSFSQTFLIAKYTFDKISIKLTPIDEAEDNGEYTILANMNIVSLQQIDENGNLSSEVNAGDFLLAEKYLNSGFYDVYVERPANLNIVDGEVYESNGALLYGRETAKSEFNTLVEDYINEDFLNGNLKNFSSYASLGELEPFWDTITGSLAGYDDTFEDKLAQLFANSLTTTTFVDTLMALKFKAGLAARMEKYTRTYYSIDGTTSTNADGTETQTGTIRYYDKHNNQIESIDYTSVRKETKTMDLNLKAVSGVVSDGFNYGSSIAYVGVGLDTLREAPASANENVTLWKTSLLDLIWSSFTGTDSEFNFNNRKVYHYTATYTFSYNVYTTASGDHILGANIDKVELKYNGCGALNSNIDSATVGQTDPGHLRLKNNNIMGSGKTVLSMAGAKGYISTLSVSDNINDGVSGTINGGANGNLTGAVWNLRGQGDYDDYFIYFSRGELNWGLVFDFCMSLPTINLWPPAFRWVFRFKLGSTYDYAQDVVYRLQAGSFYLDYNFRHATGIGISYLFRMSAINPFILIFSTVLILTILWQLIWGLIQRIYNIVLLFIMLPACCSTMPMDDGARFNKWKDELVKEVFSAYGVLIMLNLYFVLIPIVKDVTSNLIVSTDLPTTITGLFSTIKLGANRFVSKLGTLFANIGGNVSGMSLVGAASINGNMLLDLSGLTTAELNLLGYINRIIYIIFFLVLTTMLKNGKELIKTVLNLGDVNMSANKEVKEKIDEVKNNKAVELSKKAAGWAVAKGTKVAALVGNIASKNYSGAAKAGSSLLKKEDLSEFEHHDTAPTSRAEPPSGGSAPAGLVGGSPSGSPSGTAVVIDDAEPTDVAGSIPSGDEVGVDDIPAGFESGDLGTTTDTSTFGGTPVILASPPTDEVIDRFNQDDMFREASAEELESYVSELKEEHEAEMAELQKSIDELANKKTDISQELDNALKRRGEAYAKTSELKEQEMQLRKSNASSEEWSKWRAENTKVQQEEKRAREDVKRLESELASVESMQQEKLEEKQIQTSEFEQFMSEANHYKDWKIQEEEIFAAAVAEEESKASASQPHALTAENNAASDTGSVVVEPATGSYDSKVSTPNPDSLESHSTSEAFEEPITASGESYEAPQSEPQKESKEESQTSSEPQSAQNVSDGTTSQTPPKKKSNIKKAVALGALAMVAPIPAVLGVVGGVMVVKGAKQIKKNGGLTATGKKLAEKLSKGNLKEDIKPNSAETAVVSASADSQGLQEASGEKIDMDKLFNEAEKEAKQNKINKAKAKVKEVKEQLKEKTDKVKAKIDSMPTGAKVAAATVAFGIPGAVVAGVSAAKKKKKAEAEAENARVKANTEARTTSGKTSSTSPQSQATSQSQTRVDRDIEREVERRVDEELDKRVKDAVDRRVEQAVRDEVQRQQASEPASGGTKMTNVEYEKKLENIEKKLTNITSSITELQDSVTNPKESKQIKEMAAKLSKITSEITELQDSVTNPKESAKMKELDAKINKINSNIEELQDSVTNPKESKQMKEMSAKLTKLSTEIDELQEFTTRGTNKGTKNN